MSPNGIDPDRQITLEEIIEFSVAWQRSPGRIDAEILTDPDGIPIGVGDSYTVQCVGLAISQADAERLGIQQNQYPGIIIITPKGHRL